MTPADAHTTSIVELLSRLVAIPSRGGLDPCEPVLECIEDWFDAHGLARRRIVSANGESLGLYAEIAGTAGSGREPPRYYVLNATLDTAGFGDLHAWTDPPLSARVVDGWMFGRGVADSKAGVALFAHLLAALARRRDEFSGRLGVLFDLDEHTGRFGGARAFFDSDARARPDGVLIGYPGLDRVMVGSRGFLRARLVVHGVAAHSGGSARGLNAAVRGAALARTLHELALPAAVDAHFERSAQLTVTSMQSGDGGFTAVPDRCDMSIDIRLVPGFDAQHAQQLIAQALDAHDSGYPAELATGIEWIPGWPPYRLPDDDPMVRALCNSARAELGTAPRCAVAGPSNIGNYLASLAVPALCGFGVRGEQMHATDERVELASIAPVYRIYEHTLLRLLRGGQ